MLCHVVLQSMDKEIGPQLVTDVLSCFSICFWYLTNSHYTFFLQLSICKCKMLVQGQIVCHVRKIISLLCCTVCVATIAMKATQSRAHLLSCRTQFFIYS